MRLIRPTDHRRTTWKNGGGETREIALAPSCAALDGFDWRISAARIAADGPFSRFPAIDRTLMILEGDGIRLTLDGGAPVDLTADSEPIAFRGDIPASAALIAGPVTDLNIMTRRGRFTHSVARHRVAAPSDLAIVAETALLLCADGRVQVTTSDGTARLAALESLLAEDYRGGPWRLVPETSCVLVLIEISNVVPRVAREGEGSA
jgi:environmental stress-induced protein Ves